MRVYFIMTLLAIVLSGAVAVSSSNPSDDTPPLPLPTLPSNTPHDDIFGPFYNGYTTTCSHTDNNMVRLVRVGYVDDTEHVPCEVLYAKPTEQPDAGYQVLWHAHHTEGYCERKAELLVNRLKGWGWQCGEPVWSEGVAESRNGGHPVPGNPESGESRGPDNNDNDAEDVENSSSNAPTPNDCERFGGYYCD